MLKTSIRFAVTALVASGGLPASAGGPSGTLYRIAAPVPDTAREADAAPADYIMVRRQGETAPKILAGIIVHAAAEELDRFDDVALHFGVRMQRLPDGKEVESIALFLAQPVGRDAVIDLYRQLLAGALGKLRVEAMIVAPEDIRSGVKPSDILHVVPAEEIELPR